MSDAVERRGFVLVTVLGVVVGLATLALGVALSGRSALAVARNRVALTAARWRAEGCLERSRAALFDAIAVVPPDGVAAVWDSADRVLAAAPVVTATQCVMTVRAAGAGLSVNDADGELLRALFLSLQISPARADSLTDALLDWRDADTLPRASGAERAWYAAAGRATPRDSAFTDTRELLLVRGFEHFGDTLALLTVDQGRMPLSHIPLSVLAILPGITPAVLAHAADLRRRGERIPELSALGATLPQDAQHALMQHYTELSRLVTATPDAWIVQATVTAGDPPVSAEASLRLVRSGRQLAVAEQR